MKIYWRYGLIISFCLWLCACASASSTGETCYTQFLVTTPQTVAFFLGPERKENFVGRVSVGSWLKVPHRCIHNQVIHALVFDSEGRKHTYPSTQRYTNIDNVIVVIYPQDFSGAPTTDAQALCQIHLLNNSDQTIAVYDQYTRAARKLLSLPPWQNQLSTAPCFENAHIVVRVITTSAQGEEKELGKYRSKQTYTDLNHTPYIIYPEDFT
jgi:hypothetical protein